MSQTTHHKANTTQFIYNGVLYHVNFKWILQKRTL